MNHQLLTRLSQDDTSLTPREVVHAPEGVQGKEEREHRDGQDVEHHPADHVPLATHDEDQGLNTVYSRQHDNGESGDTLMFAGYQIDEIDDL